jgi:hypothetical protein
MTRRLFLCLGALGAALVNCGAMLSLRILDPWRNAANEPWQDSNGLPWT